MNEQFQAIAPGFGVRLKEERTRLRLNQTEFAEIAGIQRLAQGQYESEVRAPNLRYLSAIGAAGVSLYYLLFGRADVGGPLPPDAMREIEKRAFELIEEIARSRFAGTMSADARFVLFEVFRAHLIHAVRNGTSVDLSVIEPLIAGRAN